MPAGEPVHPLVHVEGIGLPLTALVVDAALREAPQRPKDDVRGAYADILPVVPERLDVHHVLDAVSAAQGAAEHRSEHVSVGECRLGPAALPKVSVDHGAQPAAVEHAEYREKSPERVDVVRF